MTHRIDRTIDSIIGQLEHLTTKLPAARTTLINQLAHVADITASRHDQQPSTTSNGSTVEAAVLAAAHIRTQLDNLSHELNAITLIATNLNRDCDRIIGTRTPTDRCDSGIGRDGYNIPRQDGGWSDPTCWNVPPDNRKTCDACRQRADRWKRQHEGTAA